MDFLRKLVSKKRKRFVTSEFNLDLSYITPRVIAMSFPASGMESMYRNKIEDVAKFLKQRHGNDYYVINVSSRKYDYSKFGDRVIDIVWPNHHPCEFLGFCRIILETCRILLSCGPDMVVVVHCLGGKGRTGSLINCLLWLTGLFESVVAANEYYLSKRQVNVTYASQVETLRHFALFFEKGLEVISPFQKRLRTIRVRSSDILFLGERIFKLKLYDFCKKNYLLYERCFGVELKPIKPSKKKEQEGRMRNMTQPIDEIKPLSRDEEGLDEDTIKKYLSERPDVDFGASGSIVRLPSMVGQKPPKLGLSRSQSDLEDSEDSADECLGTDKLQKNEDKDSRSSGPVKPQTFKEDRDLPVMKLKIPKKPKKPLVTKKFDDEPKKPEKRVYTVEIETENAAPLQTMDLLIRFKSDNLTGFKSLFRLNVTLFTLEVTSQVVQRPMHSEIFWKNFRETNFVNLESLKYDELAIEEDHDPGHRYTNLNDGIRPKMDSKNNIKCMGLDLIREVEAEGKLTREIKAEIEAMHDLENFQQVSKGSNQNDKDPTNDPKFRNLDELQTTPQPSNFSKNKSPEVIDSNQLKPMEELKLPPQPKPRPKAWPRKPEFPNCQFTKTFKRDDLDAVDKYVPKDFEIELEFEYAISDPKIFENWVVEWRKVEKMRREVRQWLSEGGCIENRSKILLWGDENLVDVGKGK